MSKKSSKKLGLLIGALAPIVLLFYSNLKPTPQDADFFWHDEFTKEYMPACKGVRIGDSFVTAQHCAKSTLYFKSDNNYAKLPENSFEGTYSENHFTGNDVAIFGDAEINFVDCGEAIYSIDLELKCDVSLVDNIMISTDCVKPEGFSGKGYVNKDGQLCAIYSGFYKISKNDEELRVAIFNRLPSKDNNND